MRQEDLGILWEHLVLEHVQAHFPDTPVRYWRDKQGRELDFVLARGRDAVDVIECKWNIDAFDRTALDVFRGFYPKAATTWSALRARRATASALAAMKCASAHRRNCVDAFGVQST